MLQRIQYKPSNYQIAYIKSDTPKMVPIAPAPDRKYLTLDVQVDKKKYNYKNNLHSGSQVASIARRNARERNRVKQVNDGFNALRKRLPAAVIGALSGGARRGSGKKLSKVDTLKMVVEYIKYLQNMINESDATLGITRPVQSQMACEGDEGIFGDSSPYTESVPSPGDSDCSSGVSSAYSSSNCPNNYKTHEQQVCQVDEDGLLDAVAWW